VSEAPITALLKRAREGDSAARNEVFPLVYEELRRAARLALRRDRHGHTLQPTALIHEAYLRLFGGRLPDFHDRVHFLGIASRVMRQVLVDYARARGSQKRDGGIQVKFEQQPVSSQDPAEIVDLDAALDKLAAEDTKLVAVLEMRFFAGMTAEEIADATAESVHIVRHDLRYAQARLRQIYRS
jgi:RNA polymerase sigma-70 factor, ECF subfamily